MAKKYNFVYLTINLINNFKYIGSHSTNDLNDGYLGSGKILKQAIKKFGKTNFKKEILEECETIFQARLLEEKFINQFNTLIPKGYNLSPTGGCSHLGGELSIDHKKSISESLQKNGSKKKEKHHMWGKKLSESHNKALHDARKGTHLTDDEKQNLSIKAKLRVPTYGNQKNFSDNDKDYIIKRHIHDNISYGRISKELGVHKDRVKRFLIKNNLYKGALGMSQESKDKLSEERKGLKRSEETILKISKSLKGKTPWNKGIKIK